MSDTQFIIFIWVAVLIGNLLGSIIAEVVIKIKNKKEQ